MKRRTRRAVIAAAALVAVLVAVLAVANWGTMRDHVEAWHFQLTRETKTFEPQTPSEGDVLFARAHTFQILATYANRAVIFDPAVPEENGDWTVHRGSRLTPEEVLRVMKEEGWRVLEQRFPRRAYVVIRVDPVAQTIPLGGPLFPTPGSSRSWGRERP